MVALSNYPSGLLDLLDRKGVSEDKITLIARCDMNKDGAHCDCFLVATGEELLIVSGIMTLRGNHAHKHFAGAAASRLEAEFKELSYECHMLGDLDDLTVEELL